MTLLSIENIHILPTLHYTMECAVEAKRAVETLKPDCIAVELAESLHTPLLQAAARLPDVSVVSAGSPPLYYLAEPCDSAFEGLRSALEEGQAAFCIDLEVRQYPRIDERLPDPYAITHIGLGDYFAAYRPLFRHPLDEARELYMARRLKELSCNYERVLFICGFAHARPILALLKSKTFPELVPSPCSTVELATLTEESAREVMSETGWVTCAYEEWRAHPHEALDRKDLLFELYQTAAQSYVQETGHTFHPHQLQTTMKYARNYAHLTRRLLPDFYQTLVAAGGCVDHNFAYEVWKTATSYPPLKNIDNLPEKQVTIKEIWGHEKRLRFHLRQKQRKGRREHFFSPSSFSICSYPPEDVIVETFGDYLKKKGAKQLSEEGASIIPFTTSLEEGIDTRETIRRWHEGKLYVKKRGKPPGGASSVVMIFEEEAHSRYRWRTTWIGEHAQESDMAFYATPLGENVVGPGICRCEYGGLMLTSPPRRLLDVWNDPDYALCPSPEDLLLMAAIDYATEPVIVYVAKKPPRSKFKDYATRFGKRVVYIPIGQLSPILLNKLRIFHVLDGHDKRELAGDYIF